MLNNPISRTDPTDTAASLPTSAARKKKRQDPWEDIHLYLRGLNPGQLTAIIVGAAKHDEELYRALLIKADRSADGRNVATTLRQAIEHAVFIDHAADWREAGAVADKLHRIVDSLEQLMQPSSALMLVELTEFAIERIEQALAHLDDSDGEIAPIVAQLGELHLDACRMARAEPLGLAERLFALTTTLPFRICDFDPGAYADCLGAAGMARYQALAHSAWNALAPCAPDGFDTHRFCVTRIMERLAELSGDVDQLVAIKLADLSSPYRYLQLAIMLAEHGRPADALDWAERGMLAHPDRPDNRLRDFLAAAYMACGRGAEALPLVWAQFEERATLEHYQKLQRTADRLGVWPAQRERALSALVAAIAVAAQGSTRWTRHPSVPDYSLRVAIALWEDEPDTALAFVEQGQCDRGNLLALAQRLAKERPGKAIALYRRLVPSCLEQTSNHGYQEAIKLIRLVGTLMRKHEPAAYGPYLAELRATYKQKRNFIKLLDPLIEQAG
ncbi:MAG: hypothetical protein V4754_02035 [Pseudomonadota bacterium]